MKDKFSKNNILVILLIIAIILVLVFNIKYFFGGKNSNSVNNQYKSVAFGKQVFNFTDDYEYAINDKIMTIAKKDASWITYIEYFSDVKRNVYTEYEDIEKELQKNGYNVKNGKLVVIDETMVFLMEYYKDDYVGLLAEIRDDEDAYEITLYNADKSLNIEPLYEIMKLF